MRRLIFPIVLGVAGIAVLLGLGKWQLDRLAWKEGVLAGIEARIAGQAVDLPLGEVTEEAHEYAPVTVTGAFTGERLFVLTSTGDLGPAYRVIEVFESEGGNRLLVDRGAMPVEAREAELSPAPGTWRGNLLWPDEVDGFTPEPEGDLWFARNAPAMGAALDALPVIVVLAEQTDPALTPLPVSTAGIPNDHLEYAITWFALAVVWAAMSVYLIWRVMRAPQGKV